MANHHNRRKPKGRSATIWHVAVDKCGRTIRYVTSDECTVNAVGVCSVLDPDSDAPSYRLLEDGSRRLLDQDSEGWFPDRGLVVLGTCKFDRPTLGDMRRLTGLRGKAVAEAIDRALRTNS